jgi:hypothetical protein
VRRAFALPPLPLLLAALAPSWTLAAAGPAPPPTRTSVVSIGDVRGGDSSRLEIELELPDFPASDVAAARLRVRKAVDDTGRDLLPEEEGKGRLESLQREGTTGPDDKPVPAVVPMKLRNPARRAKSLKEVSGEIELYVPGRDPNAVTIIPAIGTRTGKRLESPALTASGVRIEMLTEEQLQDEKKRQAEKRKEDAKKHGAIGEMLEPLASAFLQAFFTPGPGDVIFSVEDPEGRLVQMTLRDASGVDQTTGRMQQQGLTVLSSSRRGPGPDWSLEVRLKTPKSLVLRSFMLKGVPLP